MSGPVTLVRGGRVVAETGVVEAHVLLRDGAIAALLGPDERPGDVDEVVDAHGLTVLPGAIDCHSHFEDPGRTTREDFWTGTCSAAGGGFTTIIEHPLVVPPTTTVDRYVAKRDMVGEKALVDFGLWGALTGPSLEHMRGQWAEGAAGFKAFTPRSDPNYPNVDDYELLEGMRIAAELGALVLVHAENDALLHGNLDRLRAEGRTDMRAHHESRPPIVEEEAARRCIQLAEHAGARLQIVHGSSPVTFAATSAAARAGRRVSSEVCPHHLLLDLDDVDRLGPYAICAPAIRERAVVEAIWDRVLAGRVDCLVSDHAAYTHEDKDVGWDDVFATPLGCQVIQETVPLVLSEAVGKRGMSLEAFARFSATNAARITGLYPRKGAIRLGADADLALYDLDETWTVDAASQQFSKNPWSPFDGRTVTGRLKRTIARGETVYLDGEITGAPGRGRFLSSQADFATPGVELVA